MGETPRDLRACRLNLLAGLVDPEDVPPGVGEHEPFPTVIDRFIVMMARGSEGLPAEEFPILGYAERT